MRSLIVRTVLLFQSGKISPAFELQARIQEKATLTPAIERVHIFEIIDNMPLNSARANWRFGWQRSALAALADDINDSVSAQIEVDAFDVER